MEQLKRILKGAIDFHVHTSPDPYRERSVDAYTAALEARDLGMEAVVLKCHDYPTAPVAQTVGGLVKGIRIIGSIALNHGVGGVNPEAVDISASMGARVVWMPTFSSIPDTKKRELDTGISILDEGGNLFPQAKQVIALAKKYELALCTGHISREEAFALAEEAFSMDIRKLVITHPLTYTVGDPLPLEKQKELTDKGAYIEHCFVATTSNFGALDPKELVDAIRYVGIEKCMLSTDFGQKNNPKPAEGMKMMVKTMLDSGLGEDELEVLLKRNPAILLGLS
jgi:hypothetical protein